MKTETILAVSTIPVTALASVAFHKGFKWSYKIAIPVAFCASSSIAVSAAFIFRKKKSEAPSSLFVGLESKTLKDLLDETDEIGVDQGVFLAI